MQKSQDRWMSVIMWVGLLFGAGYTSKIILDLFNPILNAVVSTLGPEGFKKIFSAENLGALFIFILAIALIVLIYMVWSKLVSFTFEIFLPEDEEEEGLVLASDVVRFLGFSWVAFFVIYLLLPIVF